ncbi:MAG: amidohydrolase/deacetylase family metallohydrolase [Armatimonadota bacterium]
MGTVLLRGGRALHLEGYHTGQLVDIGVDDDGRVVLTGSWDGRQRFDQQIDLGGAWLSPAWIDLHVHCYYGGTWLSVRPEQVGPATGVGLAVDCGSAGEANFAGLREFIIAPSPFPILAYLNISLIGLVAANRVSELIGDPVLHPVRTAACAEAHRDLIRGIKVRASSQVVREWGMAPVRVAKQVAAAVGLPLVVHIGEAPPTLGEILDILEPGDVITHCFTGRLTTSIGRHEAYFQRARAMQEAGLILDVGHGQGSFNYPTARRAIERGLLPNVISTDLHIGNVWGPVWDLATTMSKMLSVGMAVDDVVERVTSGPARFLRLHDWGHPAPGVPARFTAFDVRDGEEGLPDSDGNIETVRRFFEPRYTVIGSLVTAAARNAIRDRRSVSI